MGNLLDLMSFRSDATRFETMLRPHVSALYRAAFRFAGNSADAEDLIQDVMVKLYPKRDQLATVEKLRPWLMTVLYRTFVDSKRRSDRSPLTLVGNTKYGDEEGRDYFESVPSGNPGPGEIMENMLVGGRVKTALAQLGEDQRALCILHDMEGYTLTELEEMLEVPLGTLKSRLHRARARLRKLLSDGTF